MVQTGPWITQTKAQPRLRLFCFPYAGGGAAIYRTWQEQFPAEIEVCPVHLPGRESRIKEAPYTRLAPLIEALAQALEPFMYIPFAFFGHSMGTLISFELARHLRRRHAPMPVRLFVAAHRAPQLPDRGEPQYLLPDDELIDSLRRLGGTPPAILQHEELMRIVLSILRADFELCETYVYTPEEPLDLPISAYGGEQDTLVSRQELQAWALQTQRAFTLDMLAGNHFFLQSQQPLLLQNIAQQLQCYVSA
ncbi:MAG: thioesterase [Ktedonobacteraceae bacterium]|nr:thioesterase [Ktedonobacteraceae bacterium]